ncbi:MAG: LuxR C-terminal-related transcriptional regulator [Chloroflexia bacterium]
MLLLDDLHWADPASLDLLRVLARGLGDLAILLLATYRADEVARDHTLATLLPALVRESRAERLDVRPLDEAAIAALVAARYALGDGAREQLARYLALRTEGNALYVGELLRTLESEGLLIQEGDRWILGDLATAPVPMLLRQVIAGRVARVPEAIGRLLAIAAVIGQEVPLSLWAAVAESAEDDLIARSAWSIEARMLTETADGARVRFAHALIREALYGSIPAIRRRGVHRRVAEALIASPFRDPDTVAHHLQQAGDPRAVVWLIRAGLRARSRGAHITAADRFAAAATLLEGSEAHIRERGWLLYLSAELLLFADRTRTFRYLDEIDAIGTLANDPPLIAHSRQLRGGTHGNSGQMRAAVEAMEQGVAELEALPGEYRRWYGNEVAVARIGTLLPEGERAQPLATGAPILPGALRLRGTLANWYGWTGRYREARTLGEATVADALDDEFFRGDVPGRWGLAHGYAALGQPTGARHEYARARAESKALNQPYNVHYVTWAELLQAVLPYQADNVAERTLLAAEAAQAWAGAQGAAVTTLYPSQAELPIALIEGRWDEARRLALAGLDGSSGHLHGATAALGALELHQGNAEAAWGWVSKLHPAGPDTAPGDCHFVHGIALQGVAAELALASGDLATAERWIAAHGRWLAWSGAVRWHAENRLLQASHARASGDLATARRHAEAALAHANEPRQPLALLATCRLLGELATASGRHSDAQSHLDAAMELANACAALYERALCQLALAELRAAEGKLDEAGGILAESRALLEPLGARPALVRADALTARLAAPTTTSPAAVGSGLPFGLTARELDVLRLLAEGLTDPQIAERLFLSRNTINTHLRAIYGKLGVNTRAAATRLATEHRLA